MENDCRKDEGGGGEMYVAEKGCTDVLAYSEFSWRLSCTSNSSSCQGANGGGRAQTLRSGHVGWLRASCQGRYIMRCDCKLLRVFPVVWWRQSRAECTIDRSCLASCLQGETGDKCPRRRRPAEKKVSTLMEATARWPRFSPKRSSIVVHCPNLERG